MKERKIKKSLTVFLTLIILITFTQISIGDSRENSDIITTQPCIPIWVQFYEDTSIQKTSSNIPEKLNTDYQSIIELGINSDVFAIDFNEAESATQILSSLYPNPVVMHTINTDLSTEETILPLDYGKVWIYEDLDLDGNNEVVVQRGDTGYGGNGYLDIHSAPTWNLRKRIELTDMKIYANAVAVNVDLDQHLEIFLTPSILGPGTARAMIINYDLDNDTFIVTDDISAPNFTGGSSAIGDFDEDGKIEMITGSKTNYNLFEYDNGLYHRGIINGVLYGLFASSLRPKPDGALYALLGHSSSPNGYTYNLIKAIGNNTFETVQMFKNKTGYVGVHRSYAFDADNDGLDEFAMSLHPEIRIYEWDNDFEEFKVVWGWNQQQLTGTITQWADTDLDQDNVREWFCNDHNNIVRAFEDQSIPNNDNTSPEITLITPEKAIYLNNAKILPFFTTIIIGNIDIKVNVSDPKSGVNNVEFFIDNDLKTNYSNPPYIWTWSESAFLRHIIKIVAYDNSDNVATLEIPVWKFF